MARGDYLLGGKMRRLLVLSLGFLLVAIALVGRGRAEATDQSKNLIKNGLFERWVSWDEVIVGENWAPWVVLGAPRFGRHGHEPGQQIEVRQGPMIAGLYQEIVGVKPGAQYYGYVGSASLYWGNSEGKFEEVCRSVGIDPTGGTNPRSPEVVWGNVTCTNKRWDFKDDPNANAARVRAIARGPKITFFLRVAFLRGDNLAQAWFTDAAVFLETETPTGTPTPIPAFGFRPDPATNATPPPSISATAIAQAMGSRPAPPAASATAPAASQPVGEPERPIRVGEREIGRFFTQTASNGRGYSVVDREDQRWWSEFQRLGGVAALGYPISRPFRAGDGFFYYQAFQRGVLQWRPELGQAVLANSLDWLSAAGRDEWAATRGLPPAVNDDGSQGEFSRAVAIRLGWLTEPAIAQRFRQGPAGEPLSLEEAIARSGLPASQPERRGPFIIQRFQRVAFQYWIEEVAGAPPKGSVVPVLAGELLLEAGIIPADARTPEPPPQAPEEQRGGQ